jgi:hypothetical protein
MKHRNTTVMGVASIIAHPLRSNVLGTARSALVISRDNQPFQLSRREYKEM